MNKRRDWKKSWVGTWFFSSNYKFFEIIKQPYLLKNNESKTFLSCGLVLSISIWKKNVIKNCELYILQLLTRNDNIAFSDISSPDRIPNLNSGRWIYLHVLGISSLS